MFRWGKKVNKVEETKVCNHSAGTTECESVALIRELSREKQEIGTPNLDSIVRKFFRVMEHDYYYSETESLIKKIYDSNNNCDFETLFWNIGQELNVHFAKVTRLREIDKAIREERYKLGI